MKVTHQYKTFEKHNIIIDLSYHKFDSKGRQIISPLSEQYKKAKTFVIVVSDIDYNAVPDMLTWLFLTRSKRHY
jgi:hypothetical protein